MNFENTYDPIGDTVPLATLAGTVVSLTPGQYVALNIRVEQDSDAPPVRVAVTNYGHGVRIVEIGDPGPAEHAEHHPIGAEVLTERGFTPPSSNPRLVGDPGAWQWPFGVHWAGIAAEQTLWALDEIRHRTPGPVNIEITSGSLTEGAQAPDIAGLNRCLPDASHLSETVAL